MSMIVPRQCGDERTRVEQNDALAIGAACYRSRPSRWRGLTRDREACRGRCRADLHLGLAIRAAHRQDAEFLGWAILTASRGHLARGWFDIALNQPEGNCLAFVRRLTITETPSWWHYSRFLIAEVDANPVAALSAFPAGEAYALSQPAMDEAAEARGLSASERSAIWQRGGYMFLCAMTGHDDCWTMENIATLPGYRGRGLTAALLTRAAEAGRTRGFKQAQITSFIDNEPARRAYEKAGYRCIEERRHPEFEAIAGTQGLLRFVRSLSFAANSLSIDFEVVSVRALRSVGVTMRGSPS